MSEHKVYKLKDYKVPKKWKDRAFIDKDGYGNLREERRESRQVLGKQAKRIDWIKPFTKVKKRSFAYPDVSIKWFEDGTLNVCRQLHRSPPEEARQADRDHLGARRSQRRSAAHLLSRAARECLPPRQRVEGARRQARRPRHHLSADDSGGGVRHARLRAHRRDPFGGVRRLLAGFACRPYRGLQVELLITADEGLRGGRKVPLKANADEALKKVPGVRRCWWSRTGGKSPGRRSRSLAATKTRQRRRGVSSGGDERRGPAVYPLHVGLTGSPRACCIRRVAIWCMPRSRMNSCSTITRATSIGAPPMSAGSPATPISSMVRSRTGRRR